MTTAADLLEAARTVLSTAYTPYSGFKVAAALIDNNGAVFTGVNIENASFGLTICAERVAIFKAVSAGAKRVEALAIVSDKQNPCAPCGACLQVLSEFADDPPIYLLGSDGRTLVERSLNLLLPMRFDSGVLARRR